MTPVKHRLRLVRKLRALIGGHAAMLAEASASARHRPMAESLTAEVLPLAEACRFLEKSAARLLAPRRLSERGQAMWLFGVRSEVWREPVGIVLIIGPGNFPLFLPGVQLVQALAAGNAVLLKPGVAGLAAARALVELVARAGFDPSLVQLLPESVEAAQAAIAAGPDKVIFTGSAAVGEKIAVQLAERLIPCVLELSGCDAVIVRADADLDLAEKALRFALNLNDGAVCMVPQRLFVHRSLYSDSGGEATSKSPFPGAFEFLNLIAGEAPSKATWRSPLHPEGRSEAPALAPVFFDADVEVAAAVNGHRFALGASIFSRDEAAAHALAGQLDVGLVTINDIIVSSADARLPFGGRRGSGYGATRGAEGLLEMTVAKAVTVSRGRRRPAYDPLSPRDLRFLLGYARMSHGLGLRGRFGSLFSKS